MRDRLRTAGSCWRRQVLFILGYALVWTIFALFAFLGDMGIHWLVARWLWLYLHSWVIGTILLFSLARPTDDGEHASWEEVLLVDEQATDEQIAALLGVFEDQLNSLPAEIPPHHASIAIKRWARRDTIA